jgi:hypothetical protein
MYICACIWILACWLHVSTWCCIIFVLKWCVAEYYEHTSVVISSKEKALFLEHWVITQYVSLLFSFWSLGWDACLYWDKLKWNQAYPYKLVAVWMKVLLIFWLAMPLTVVADILTESYHCFQKCKKLRMPISSTSICPTVMRLCCQWVVMAASDNHFLWRWWSDTLWLTFTRLWPHHSCCVCLGWLDLTECLPSKFYCGVSSAITQISSWSRCN